jgi:hypothetical protein
MFKLKYFNSCFQVSNHTNEHYGSGMRSTFWTVLKTSMNKDDTAKGRCKLGGGGVGFNYDYYFTISHIFI